MSQARVKILFTASTFPRRPDDVLPDFVWRQVLAMRAARPGMEAWVLAPHDEGAATAERWDGVEIRRFRYVLPAGLQRLAYPAIWPNLERAPWLALQVPLLLFFEFVATLRLIRRERFDLVYSHWFVPQGVACGLAALLTGTPHAFTSHSSDVAVMRRLPGVGPWLVRALTRRARAVTAVSRRSLGHLRGFFDPGEWASLERKVAVIPMGVALDDAAPAGDGAPPGSDPGTILFVGRLVEKKGVGYLLEALATDPLRSTGATLVVAGDGPLRDELRGLADRLGIGDRVSFAGHVAGARKAALLERASVVALPSIVTRSGDAEGIPVVLLEALAAGKVSVATDASGAPEVITPGQDGFLVPAEDAPALAQGLAEALSLPEERRRSVVERARLTARRYEWTKVAAAHLDHLLGPA